MPLSFWIRFANSAAASLSTSRRWAPLVPAGSAMLPDWSRASSTATVGRGIVVATSSRSKSWFPTVTVVFTGPSDCGAVPTAPAVNSNQTRTSRYWVGPDLERTYGVETPNGAAGVRPGLHLQVDVAAGADPEGRRSPRGLELRNVVEHHLVAGGGGVEVVLRLDDLEVTAVGVVAGRRDHGQVEVVDDGTLGRVGGPRLQAQCRRPMARRAR